MARRSLARRTSQLLVAALAVLLLGVTAALAAHPVKKATYSGHITRKSKGSTVVTKLAISFRVSRSGKRVSGFKLPNDYPIYCQGGGFGQARSASAKVSKKGTFKAKLPIVFAPTHKKQGVLKISGKFKKHRRESGKVTTKFAPPVTTCNGTSKYSTKVH